ncbi:MAG: cytidine deaminase [Bacteroidales bacterium]|nr:cytidine deaminase [Bacteroidales bacterium]
MKNIEISAKIQIFHESELNESQKNVVEAAKKATFTSYAPYSNFHVGAAVLLENGVIVTGSNQENAAYPSGICAERTTLFYANSQYPDQPVRKLAIAAQCNGNFTDEVISPCGACRQVILESEYRAKAPIEILLVAGSEIWVFNGIEGLLPLGFNYNSLHQ